jgi:hypothetical protein
MQRPLTRNQEAISELRDSALGLQAVESRDTSKVVRQASLKSEKDKMKPLAVQTNGVDFAPQSGLTGPKAKFVVGSGSGTIGGQVTSGDRFGEIAPPGSITI